MVRVKTLSEIHDGCICHIYKGKPGNNRKDCELIGECLTEIQLEDVRLQIATEQSEEYFIAIAKSYEDFDDLVSNTSPDDFEYYGSKDEKTNCLFISAIDRNGRFLKYKTPKNPFTHKLEEIYFELIGFEYGKNS
jgi:hypothetical protein